MRQVKFRAWDEKLKRMFYWHEFHSLPLHDLERADLVWMQFTGLLDKNGKEIYEGDVVEAFGKRGFVKFFEEGGYFNLGIGYIESQSNEAPLCEIIGNIHQNPELLK